jgi:N-acetylmuramic acid 6-phosphate etherase
MLQAVSSALISSHFYTAKFTAVWAGFAGVGSKGSDLYSQTLDAVKDLFKADNVYLTTDAELLCSKLYSQPAYITHAIGVICGTGSVCMAFNRLSFNMIARAGGWGYILGDEGSGYHIGLEAIKSILKTHEHMQIQLATIASTNKKFSLWQLQILDQLQVISPSEPNLHIKVLKQILNDQGGQDTTTKSKIASLTRTVFSAAYPDNRPSTVDESENQKTAQKVTSGAALALVEIIKPLTVNFGGPIDPLTTVLVLGGSIVNITPLKDQLLQELTGRGLTFAGVDAVSHPGESAAICLAKVTQT